MATKLVSVSEKDRESKRCAFHTARPHHMLPNQGSCTPAWCSVEKNNYELLCASNAAEALADDLLESIVKDETPYCGTEAGSVIAIRELIRFMERNRSGAESTITQAFTVKL